MANLFWKTKQGTTSLLATPFKTEKEFEEIVFNAPEILEDVFPLKRQIRGGGKPGIPDIIGIDNDGNICIIEMKNVTVDAMIIPQVLKYASWAEKNPDSVKSLWLEAENKPDDISISWDDFEVRIIIIAPTILRSTLAIVDKINYQVDLIEVKRWVEGGDTFLLVNRLEPEEQKGKTKPVKGMETYDADFYMHRYNKNTAQEFLRYVQQVEELIRENGWNLETKFNKQHCSFKAGYSNAFGIFFITPKTLAFFFRLPEADVKASGLKMTKYEQQWKEAYFYIDPTKTRVMDFKPLFELAYRKLAVE